MDEKITDKSSIKNAVLFSIQTPDVSDADNESSLQELTRLVTTMGLKVVATLSQKKKYPSAGTILGEGKLKELAAYTGGSGVVESFSRKSSDSDKEDEDDEYLLATGFDDEDEEDASSSVHNPDDLADVVIYDGELSPRQLRNLEKATGAEVLDRTGVILEIFSRHAKSPEAIIQVEIAKLNYLAPRLRLSRVGADRQGGGIGAKGAGETSYELDKRRIRDRITELKARLVSIHAEQSRRRSRRKENFQVSLVGYTNAGKSSLMRALTGTDVLVADKLFATLDTRIRTLHPPSFPTVLVSDTVGFIKKLPHDLVASFQSTLDEALAASLLLFTVDASDPAFRSQLEVTREVLGDIGASDIPWRLILNKVDKISKEELSKLKNEYPDGVFLSAHSADDVAKLRNDLIQFFQKDMIESKVLIPYNKGQILGQLRTMATIVSESYEEEGTEIVVRTFPSTMEWLSKNLAKA